MPQSISQAQSKVTGQGGFLDLLIMNSENRQDTMQLDNVVDGLVYLAAMFTETASKKLDEKNKVASGHLADSIIPMEVEVMGSVYSISIKVADYYKFIDKGVDGWNNSVGSPYKFQNYSGRSGRKDSKMVDAIRKWVISEHLQSRNLSNKKAHLISARERSRARITDTSLGTAIAISKAVRKKGLKPTGFWTETENEVAKKASEVLGTKLKVDIINYLSS